MDIKIQKKPAFTVAGVLLEAIDNSQCPSAWEQLYANHSFESLESLGSGQSFGVCSDVKEGEIINYMAAYDVTDKAKAEVTRICQLKKFAVGRVCHRTGQRGIYQPVSTMLGNMSWKSFSQKLAIATQEHQILKFTQRETCLPQTIKWNSGYQW